MTTRVFGSHLFTFAFELIMGLFEGAQFYHRDIAKQMTYGLFVSHC